MKKNLGPVVEVTKFYKTPSIDNLRISSASFGAKQICKQGVMRIA